jgi:glycosyltransferase involved in cell wall biosynthesis
MSSIDIVVPCYRYGRYLRECVESVLTQDGVTLRVLILDDASPDETPEVASALASRDPRVTYRRHDVNHGHISTFNEGLEWCRAEGMLLLSADDYLLPGALARAMRLMDANPAMTLCFGDALEMREDDTMRTIAVPLGHAVGQSVALDGPAFIRQCAAHDASNLVPTPTAVVRTRWLRELGGYRTDLPHSGDLEMWLRLASRGPVGVVRVPQAVYRRHSANMSSAYNEDYRLADMRQRKAAFDIFLATCFEVLPQAPELHRSLVRALAREALSDASAAFNQRHMHGFHRLRAFAEQTDPEVRRSFAWMRLQIKRLLGLRLSNALHPTVARLRAAAARLRN